MIPTTRAELLAAVRGTLLHGELAGDIAGVSTDTRTIRPGDLYVPLRGERFDGHDFVADALGRGACGYLCDRTRTDVAVHPGLAIVVDDTVQALGDLAADQIRRAGLPVIAITGSTGKTTTKEMIATILATAGPVCRTQGNFNNFIGLPLSVFALQPTDRFLVLELGMSALGEIARLAAVAQPDVGVVTNVAPAHLLTLGTIETVAEAKGEMYAALRPEAIAVVNTGDPRVLAEFERRGRSRRRTYGERPEDDVRIVSSAVTSDGTPAAELLVDGLPVSLRLPILGLHNVWNAAAAIAATLDHVAPQAAAAALRGLAAPKNRMERLEKDGVTVVSDCYNANPRSMRAALDMLGAAPVTGRRIAVLGDMRELGDHTDTAHREVGALAAARGVDHLFAVGGESETVRASAIAAGIAPERVRTATDVLEVADDVRALLRPGDWVLVKGSHSLRMERLLEHLLR